MRKASGKFAFAFYCKCGRRNGRICRACHMFSVVCRMPRAMRGKLICSLAPLFTRPSGPSNSNWGTSCLATDQLQLSMVMPVFDSCSCRAKLVMIMLIMELAIMVVMCITCGRSRFCGVQAKFTLLSLVLQGSWPVCSWLGVVEVCAA